MSSCRKALARIALAAGLAGFGAGLAAQTAFPGVGRAATPKEVAVWDIDVRPDFKGLPRGSGSVAKGMEVWEAKCASCHGVFGENNSVFSPLVGGTTAEDVKTGRVARLTDEAFPGRTTLMKVPTLSTLWDYINRAMPWNNPKTLSTEEVYAVTAFLLNLGGVLPDDFVLSDTNVAEVQKRMPNRNGMTTEHGLWPGRTMGNGGRPDVRSAACMRDCEAETKVASFLPAFARNNHGNLAEQQRAVGPQRGADTTRPAGPDAAAAAATAAASAPVKVAAGGGTQAQALATQHHCTACHGMENRIVGPSFREIAAKYATRADALAYLGGKIRAGGINAWGPIPMPPQTLPDADLQAIARWLATGAAK